MLGNSSSLAYSAQPPGMLTQIDATLDETEKCLLLRMCPAQLITSLLHYIKLSIFSNLLLHTFIVHGSDIQIIFGHRRNQYEIVRERNGSRLLDKSASQLHASAMAPSHWMNQRKIVHERNGTLGHWMNQCHNYTRAQ
jgi:hypothetical protein